MGLSSTMTRTTQTRISNVGERDTWKKTSDIQYVYQTNNKMATPMANRRQLGKCLLIDKE